MNDLVQQARGEWIHFALALFLLGVGGASTLCWWLFRRAIRRTDDEHNEIKAALDSHGNRLGSHDRQIRDVRTAVAEARTKIGLESFRYTE